MVNSTFDLTLGGLIRAAVASIRDPRAGARAVIGAHFPNQILWMALVAVVTASVVIGQGSLLLVAGESALNNPFLMYPLAMCGIQLVLLVVMVHATYRIGRMMGGTGSYNGALSIVVWLQFVLACLQVLQTLALLLAPPLADVLGIVGLVLFLWLFTNFVATLHGFKSLPLVFVMILVSAFALTFVLSIVLSLLGIVGPGALNV